MSAAIALCANHPTREALGICVHCKRLVCSECSTRIDGVNHCASCLDARAAKSASEATQASGTFDRVVIVLGVALLLATVRGLLEIALRRG